MPWADKFLKLGSSHKPWPTMVPKTRIFFLGVIPGYFHWSPFFREVALFSMCMLE